MTILALFIISIIFFIIKVDWKKLAMKHWNLIYAYPVKPLNIIYGDNLVFSASSKLNTEPFSDELRKKYLDTMVKCVKHNLGTDLEDKMNYKIIRDKENPYLYTVNAWININTNINNNGK